MKFDTHTFAYVGVFAAAAVSILTAACREDISDAYVETRGTSAAADTTIVADDASGRSLALHKAGNIEDISYEHVPTTLGGETWRWVGIGDGDSYKPLFSWRGSAMYYIGFLSNGGLDMNCGANTVYGSYTVDGSSLSFGPLSSTKVGTLSEVENMCDDFFIDACSRATTYEITDGGLLRIYYSDTAYLQFVSAKAAGGYGVGFATVPWCFGTWHLVGAYYANGAFTYGGNSMVQFNNDYTVVTSGGGSLLVPSLADGLHFYELEHSCLSVGGRRYHVVADGSRMYLCAGLDLTSPTLVLERDVDSPDGIAFGTRVQRDGFNVEIYTTDTLGLRKESFTYGENVVFNIAIANECDTAITLPAPGTIVDYSWHMQFWLEGSELERPRQMTYGGQRTPNEPTVVEPHATLHWQTSLYYNENIEVTPPLGISKQTAVFDEGTYHVDVYLVLDGHFAVRLRYHFTITKPTDGIKSIPFA